ncbi:hypothetical protein SCB29_33800 [Paraburkholderia sp. SIMBA_055]
METRRYLRAFFLLNIFFLSGCLGYGDWGTCRTPCQKGYHRNVTCDCDKDSSLTPDSPWNKRLPPVAGRDFKWAENNCSMNNIVWLYNVSGGDVWAKYSWRKNNGTDERNFDTRFVKKGFRGYEDAVKNGTVLGYNYLNNKECTPVDYRLELSEAAQVQDLEKHLGQVAEDALQRNSRLTQILVSKRFADSPTTIDRSLSSHALVARDAVRDRETSTVRITEVKRLNCPVECNGGPTPSLHCLKGTPADQAGIKKMRDSLQEPIQGDAIKSSDIQRIFGKTSNNCRREEIKIHGKALINNGGICAYPFYFNDNDKVPSVVLHVPQTLSATRLAKADLSAIEFPAVAEMPVLVFRDADINDVWGGSVVAISVDGNGIYYQTTGGCIALDIKN